MESTHLSTYPYPSVRPARNVSHQMAAALVDGTYHIGSGLFVNGSLKNAASTLKIHVSINRGLRGRGDILP